MTGLLDSPVRNLVVGVCYVLTVMAIATVAYMAAGWSFRDAIYMVISTVYTVGYEEVRPINTPALNIITLSLIVLGCTGNAGLSLHSRRRDQRADLAGRRRDPGPRAGNCVAAPRRAR
jgi:hypothetical protein